MKLIHDIHLVMAKNYSENLREEVKKGMRQKVEQGILPCHADAVSVAPTYRKPFDVIFKRAHLEEWSGREDSNLRPPGPENATDSPCD